MWSGLQGLQPRVRLGTTGAPCFFRPGWRRLTRGGHLVCSFKSASAPRREGNRIPAKGWKPGTCSCSWIWSLRRWISRRCISMILPVSSCSFSLTVGGMPGKSLPDSVGDRAGLVWACYWAAAKLILPSASNLHPRTHLWSTGYGVDTPTQMLARWR